MHGEKGRGRGRISVLDNTRKLLYIHFNKFNMFRFLLFFITSGLSSKTF